MFLKKSLHINSPPTTSHQSPPPTALLAQGSLSAKNSIQFDDRGNLNHVGNRMSLKPTANYKLLSEARLVSPDSQRTSVLQPNPGQNSGRLSPIIDEANLIKRSLRGPSNLTRDDNVNNIDLHKILEKKSIMHSQRVSDIYAGDHQTMRDNAASPYSSLHNPLENNKIENQAVTITHTPSQLLPPLQSDAGVGTTSSPLSLDMQRSDHINDDGSTFQLLQPNVHQSSAALQILTGIVAQSNKALLTLDSIPEKSPELPFQSSGRLKGLKLTTLHDKSADKRKRAGFSVGERRSSGQIGGQIAADLGRSHLNMPLKTNRYEQRKKAQEHLKRLEIVDVSRSPQSVLSHGMLTQNTNPTDLLTMHGFQSPSQKATLENVLNRDLRAQEYMKRQRPQKLDLDLTLLQVLDGQRGGGSQVRVNQMNFLPQIRTTTNAERVHKTSILGELSMQRDEKMFLMRKAIRMRQDRIQKDMNVQVNQAKLNRLSPTMRDELQKVIFEEWTVEGKQETIESKQDLKNKAKQAKMLNKNISHLSAAESQGIEGSVTVSRNPTILEKFQDPHDPKKQLARPTEVNSGEYAAPCWRQKSDSIIILEQQLIEQSNEITRQMQNQSEQKIDEEEEAQESQNKQHSSSREDISPKQKKERVMASLQTSFDSLLNSQASQRDIQERNKDGNVQEREPTTLLSSPSRIAINTSVTQSYEAVKPVTNPLLDAIPPVSQQKPILVSKQELLEQVLQKSHASSFVSDDQPNSSLHQPKLPQVNKNATITLVQEQLRLSKGIENFKAKPLKSLIKDQSRSRMKKTPKNLYDKQQQKEKSAKLSIGIQIGKSNKSVSPSPMSQSRQPSKIGAKNTRTPREQSPHLRNAVNQSELSPVKKEPEVVKPQSLVKSTVFSTSTKKLTAAAQQTDFEELDLRAQLPMTANVEATSIALDAYQIATLPPTAVANETEKYRETSGPILQQDAGHFKKDTSLYQIQSITPTVKKQLQAPPIIGKNKINFKKGLANKQKVAPQDQSRISQKKLVWMNQGIQTSIEKPITLDAQISGKRLLQDSGSYGSLGSHSVVNSTHNFESTERKQEYTLVHQSHYY